MKAFILATDFDFIAYMSKMAFFGKLFPHQWRFWNMFKYLLCFHKIYVFIGLRRDTYEPVCFKLLMMPDATKLYTTIPVYGTGLPSRSQVYGES